MVVTEVIDDLRFLKRIFAEVEQQFKNADYQETFREFFKVFEQAHRELFSSRSSPTGEAWKPLAPATVERKGNDTHPIDTGRLAKSLLGTTGDSIREATNRSMLFGTSVDYGIFHQSGTRTIPQREFVGLSDKEGGSLDRLVDAIAEKTIEEMKPKV